METSGPEPGSRPRDPSAEKARESRYVVAVIGNPNTGKTTLFNALTGLTQRTGNYPGVTVESALGNFKVDNRQFLAIDLPGSYSLSPRAPDEMEAVRVLLGTAESGTRPDVVLCVVDATNLERNLYLLTQVMEMGLPVVAALTMVDVARNEEIGIDAAKLEKHLGVPVVPVQANRRKGISALRRTLLRQAEEHRAPARRVFLPAAFDRETDNLAPLLGRNGNATAPPRFMLERLLIDRDGFIEGELARRYGEDVRQHARRARARLASVGPSLSQIEVDARYEWIGQVVGDTVTAPATAPHAWTERIDRVVTHKLWGPLVFLGATAVVFQAIFAWALPFMDAIEAVFGALGATAGALLPAGAVRSLVVDGVIGGVGALVVFVPQIAILFALITILEDSGYMARAAFVMDRIMASFGLSGRSFIPLLSSFACAVPGIMSARAIENRRDRIATILIAPLMSCSARLPVYVLFITAFIPATVVGGVIGVQGLTLFGMYLIGLAAAPLVALALKRTALRGPPVPFLVELPPYKIPSWRVVVFRVYDRSWAFVRRAGTIILATTILIWALSYYPSQPQITEKYDALRAAATTPEEVQRLGVEEAGTKLRGSFLGRAGVAIEPLVKPLGWDWKIGMATLASFPAREVVIAALGTIYNLGSAIDEDSVELRQAMRAQRRPDGQPVYTPVVALSIMVFFALCCQCAATLATIRRETNSWGPAVFAFVYMTTLAYIAALAVYQIGSRLAA